MNPFAWSGLLVGLSSLAFGFLVLFKSPNRSLAKIWFLFSCSVAVWGFGGMWLATQGVAENAFFILKLTYAFGVLWIASFFHHFVCVFLDIKNRTTVIANYLISFAFLLFLPTSLFFKEPYLIFESMYFGRGGVIFPIYFVWWVSIVLISHYQMIRAYGSVSEIKKNQIKYFFLAVSVGFTGGSMAYLLNFGITSIYPWGNFAVCVYPYIMAYAIIKHQLLDIHIIIRKALVYSVCAVIAIGSYISLISHFTHRQVIPLANFSILTSGFSLLMAIFVLSRGLRKRIVQMWALMCIGVALWSFGFGMMIKAPVLAESLYWQRIMYAGAIFIPIIFLHFVSLLLGIVIQWKLWAGYVIAIILEVLNFWNVLASAAPTPPFPFYSVALFPAYHLYTAYFFGFVGYSLYLLFKFLRVSSGTLKNQIKFVAAGTLVGFLGGCMTFPLSFGISVFPIGVYLVVFYLVAVTYAIFKHQLMDLSVVLRKSLVYTLMTGVLTVVYLVFITQGAHLVQSFFGASTVTTSIIAACVITLGFLPLRDKIQLFADRYFFRDWSERGDMIREVAAGFSHELKSPLAGLSMQAQLTLSELENIEKDPASLQEALPRIKEELHYMVNKAMDAARRIEAVRGVAEPSKGEIGPVDVAAVLDNSLNSLQSLINDVRAHVKRDLPTDLSPVRSNLKQLEIVFINLIKNALEAMDSNDMGKKSELILAGREQADYVQISIQDTGAGIAAKELGRVFDPYYSTKGRKGTGMGLFLARQIVKAHGGSIEVQSEERVGTQFIVQLPKYTKPEALGSHAAA